MDRTVNNLPGIYTSNKTITVNIFKTRNGVKAHNGKESKMNFSRTAASTKIQKATTNTPSNQANQYSFT